MCAGRAGTRALIRNRSWSGKRSRPPNDPPSCASCGTTSRPNYVAVITGIECPTEAADSRSRPRGGKIDDLTRVPGPAHAALVRRTHSLVGLDRLLRLRGRLLLGGRGDRAAGGSVLRVRGQRMRSIDVFVVFGPTLRGRGGGSLTGRNSRFGITGRREPAPPRSRTRSARLHLLLVERPRQGGRSVRRRPHPLRCRANPSSHAPIEVLRAGAAPGSVPMIRPCQFHRLLTVRRGESGTGSASTDAVRTAVQGLPVPPLRTVRTRIVDLTFLAGFHSLAARETTRSPGRNP